MMDSRPEVSGSAQKPVGALPQTPPPFEKGGPKLEIFTAKAPTPTMQHTKYAHQGIATTCRRLPTHKKSPP